MLPKKMYTQRSCALKKPKAIILMQLHQYYSLYTSDGKYSVFEQAEGQYINIIFNVTSS